jgi:hypothetical protein
MTQQQDTYVEMPRGTIIPARYYDSTKDVPYGLVSRLRSVPNTFSAEDNGSVIAQLIGTGQVAQLQINDTIWGSLNNGVALTSGAIYEFQFHVLKSWRVTIVNCTVALLFFKRDE